PPSGRGRRALGRMRAAAPLPTDLARWRTTGTRSRRPRRRAPPPARYTAGGAGGRGRLVAAAADASASPLPVLADEVDSARAVTALPGADLRGTDGDLRTAQPSALCQESPGLLLDRDIAKASLEPETLGHIVVEIADDDGRHRSASVLRYQR